MGELKPCPFCGGDAELITGAPEYYVYCVECGASSEAYSNKRRAIEAWNMRAGCENCAALNKAAGLWAKADKRARDLERTCKDVSERPSRFKCSECECVSLEFAAFFCPYCGAKVVN